MPLRYSIATVTDVGQRRERNEDAVAAEPEHGLLVVADGMGGHPAGDVASRLAVEEVLRTLVPESGDGDGGDTETTLPSPPDRDEGWEEAWGEGMKEAVRSADQRVRSEGLRNPERAGMGTTLTAFQLDPATGRFVIGHAGDSRAYRFRDRTLELLTRDDTWIQTQVEAGRIDEESARFHPWGSMLSQALGLEKPVEPSVVHGTSEPGDVYLLCSDGLGAMLSDREVEYLLGETLSEGLDATARLLVKAANRRGGVDNITVGLMGVSASDPVAWERDPD